MLGATYIILAGVAVVALALGVRWIVSRDTPRMWGSDPAVEVILRCYGYTLFAAYCGHLDYRREHLTTVVICNRVIFERRVEVYLHHRYRHV